MITKQSFLASFQLFFMMFQWFFNGFHGFSASIFASHNVDLLDQLIEALRRPLRATLGQEVVQSALLRLFGLKTGQE